MNTPSHRRNSALGALALLLAACGGEAPAPESRLLVVDGIEIALTEVEPYIKFLADFMPNAGRKTRVQLVLDQYLLPLRLAQRAFPSQRAEQLARAEALCAIATNVAELEQQAALLPPEMKDVRYLRRTQARLPVAMFLFDQMLQGSVSRPIEVPSGYFVVGCLELRESQSALDDHAKALQIGFVTHTGTEWKQWLEAEHARVADKVTFVHPDYR
ncbi:MAG TPA: hypothetical protein VFT55_17935, partial [Planctomycetota bacterium]|nr:hypothetical protein [Planctomycetota bacterium]